MQQVNEPRPVAFPNRNYVLLWSGNSVSVIGDYLLFLALPVWVFELTGSSLALSVTMVAQLLPGLVAPLAGAVADALDRRGLMFAMDILRGLLLLVLLAVHDRNQVWLIYGVASLMSVCSQFFGPARAALLPAVVAKPNLVQANALMAASSSGAQLLGSGLGPLLLMTMGPKALILLDVATFVFSALMVRSLRVPPEAPGDAHTVLTLGAIWEGFATVGRSRLLSWIATLAGLEMLAARPLILLNLVFITQALHLPPEHLGYLVTMQGVGNLVGASLITRLWIRTSPQALVSGGLAILTVGSLGFVLSHGVAAAFTAYFLIGVGIGIKSTGDQTSIQMHVAPEALGRVWATISMVPMLVSLGVAPLAGWLGDRLPVRTVLHGSWVIFGLGTALAVWGLGHRESHHLSARPRAG